MVGVEIGGLCGGEVRVWEVSIEADIRNGVRGQSVQMYIAYGMLRLSTRNNIYCGNLVWGLRSGPTAPPGQHSSHNFPSIR